MRFFRKKQNSGKSAKKRLQAVISRDRANVSAEFLASLSQDMICAAMKYIVPDEENISVFIERTPSCSVLCARLPIREYKKS